MQQACSRSCKVIHSWVARLFHELDSIRSMLVTWVTRLASRPPNNKPTFQHFTPLSKESVCRLDWFDTDDGTRPNEMTYVRIYVKIHKVSRNATGLFPRSRTKNLLERGDLSRIPFLSSHRAGSIGKKQVFPKLVSVYDKRAIVSVLHQWALRKNDLIGRVDGNIGRQMNERNLDSGSCFDASIFISFPPVDYF